MTIVKLTHRDVQRLTEDLFRRISEKSWPSPARVYGVPRGGIYIAYRLPDYTIVNDYPEFRPPNYTIVDDPKDALLFVDDIIDSGKTRDEYAKKYPGVPFYAMINKTDPQCPYLHDWVVFPWEHTHEAGFEDNVVRLLQYVGEDVSRGGLKETPSRVAKAWKYWCSGYNVNPSSVLKVFEDGAEKHDQMVTVKDIPFYSHCEHHLAPIFGTVTISYIPDGKIVGLSKLSRLVDVFARRLQVQERLTDQIADSLFEHLNPLGVGVLVKARHLCMESRGVCQQGHHTITTALRGVIKSEPETRQEFLKFAV